MCRLLPTCLAAAFAVGLIGCRSSCDKVEAELRAREEDVRTLRDDLQRSSLHNQLLLREIAAVRGEPGPNGLVEKPTEPWPVRSIRLGRQTGGRASDTCPGDDALVVMLEPIDCEGQPIKAPGSMLVAVLEAPEEGIKRPLSVWEVSAEELRGKWQSGLFTTGYVVNLPWKVWPSTPKLRVSVRFRMVSGRVFEADKDITVRLAPAHLRPRPEAENALPGGPTPAVPTPNLNLPWMTPPAGSSTPMPEELGGVPGLPHPTPKTTLPPAKEVTPAPRSEPEKEKPLPAPAPDDGPRLMHSSAKPRPAARILRPIPVPPSE